ncbi:Pyruvate carboxylase [Pelomyxa schiedti]|nr:Pyruvate carboxylase [Pelomyxa schiedti]
MASAPKTTTLRSSDGCEVVVTSTPLDTPTFVPGDPLGYVYKGMKYKDKVAYAALSRMQSAAAPTSASASANCGTVATTAEKDLSFSSVKAEIRDFGGYKCVWISHDQSFFNGTIGCVEGEVMARALEKAYELKLPLVLSCSGGGLRIQEGSFPIHEMAKYFTIMSKLKDAGIPTISIFNNPSLSAATVYGSASDITIGLRSARIGIFEELEILETVFKGDYAPYDVTCPPAFQTSQFVYDNGRLDIIVDHENSEYLRKLLHIVSEGRRVWHDTPRSEIKAMLEAKLAERPLVPPRMEVDFDLVKLRDMGRIQVQDCLDLLFEEFVELHGDGNNRSNTCTRGGVALLNGLPVMVIGTDKGHTPELIVQRNYGMVSPGDLRFARRILHIARRWRFPLIVLADCPGALPTFESEEGGVYKIISELNLGMTKSKVPVISFVLSEAGSGGAACLCNHTDSLVILSNAYFGVMTPEAAASVLGGSTPNMEQGELINKIMSALQFRGPQLFKMGLVDQIVQEGETIKETIDQMRACFFAALAPLVELSPQELVEKRFHKFRPLRKSLQEVGGEEMEALMKEFQNALKAPPPARPSTRGKPTGPSNGVTTATPAYMRFLSEMTLLGLKKFDTEGNDDAKNVEAIEAKLPKFVFEKQDLDPSYPTIKAILDGSGPAAVSQWLILQGPHQVFFSDTSLCDGQQCLLSGHVRTRDLLAVADIFSHTVLVNSSSLFSLEIWGEEVFHSCLTTLNEDPWERLRLLRASLPQHVALQMVLSGDSLVSLSKQPRDVARIFITAAARNGIDVFRIYDNFNNVSNMMEIAAIVNECQKISELTICFCGDFENETETVYTLDYYKRLANSISKTCAHILALEDMAGIVKPSHAAPLLAALREASGNRLPIHFHTHDTTGVGLQTVISMVEEGCEIVDVCVPQCMAETPSQPSLSALALTLKCIACPREVQVDAPSLAEMDSAWRGILRAPWYSKLNVHHCPSTAAYSHALPGWQYNTMYRKCQREHIEHLIPQVLVAYKQTDLALGRIIKVTAVSTAVLDHAIHSVVKGVDATTALLADKICPIPQTVKDMLNGVYGMPEAGFPAGILSATASNPLKHGAPPELDLENVSNRVKKAFPNAPTPTPMEYILNAALFNDAYLVQHAKWVNHYGTLTSGIPSRAFWSGMPVGSSVHIHNYSSLSGNHCPPSSLLPAYVPPNLSPSLLPSPSPGFPTISPIVLISHSPTLCRSRSPSPSPIPSPCVSPSIPPVSITPLLTPSIFPVSPKLPSPCLSPIPVQSASALAEAKLLSAETPQILTLKLNRVSPATRTGSRTVSFQLDGKDTFDYNDEGPQASITQSSFIDIRTILSNVGLL